MQTRQKKKTVWVIETGGVLWIFNPEHDYALAANSATYTAPSGVVKLREQKSLMPALYADVGDFILIPALIYHNDCRSLQWWDLVQKKKLSVITYSELESLEEHISQIKPWGWDKTLKAALLEAGVNRKLLPTDEDLENIRTLSHRRNVMPFLKHLAEASRIEVMNTPQELFSIEEAEEYLLHHPRAFFKAPWSSSGRGITSSSHISHRGLMEWIHGILRRQGSVMAEPAWDKVFDFATEWNIENGEANFAGVSVFRASGRGKYHSNVEGTQQYLMALIKEAAPGFDMDMIEAQKSALESLIAPRYSGPLGIDMLADSEGRINPCVEINLRMTMGHLMIMKK